MKFRRIFLFLLLATMLSAAVLPAYATGHTSTIKAAYTGAWPPDGPSARCVQSGTMTSIGVASPAGVSATCDDSGLIITDAMGYGGTASDQFSASPLTYGLVGAWYLQEGSGTKAYDLSHGNNTGTLTNSPTWISGQGLTFASASSQYVTMGNVLGTTNPFTLACSFETTTGTGNTLLSKGSASSSTNYALTVTGAGTIRFDITSVATEYTALSSSTVTDGSKHVLLSSWTGSQMVIYIDGAPNGTPLALSTAPNTYTTAFSLGSGGGGGGNFFNGNIYWCAVWNYSPSNIASFASQLNAMTVPNLEHATGSSGVNVTNTFYEQKPVSLGAGVGYTSLGQSLTTGPAGTYWVDSPTTVSQPIKLTSTNTGTFALSSSYANSPCNLSTSTIQSDSTVHTITEYQGCSTTITVPTDGASARFRFVSVATTSVYTASTTEYDVTAYYQYALTLDYAISGGGSPTAPTFTTTQSGASYTPTLTTSPTVYWPDVNAAWSITNPLGGSSSTERWDSNGVLSGTVSNGETIAPVYIHQFQGNVSYATSGNTRTPYTNKFLMDATQFGSPLVITLASSYAPYWFDAGTSWSVPNPTYNNLERYIPSPTTASVSAKFQQTITFTAGSAVSCAGPNPLVVLEQGCVIPAVVATLSAPIGLQPWAGFVLLGINVAVYNKTQSIWMALLVLWISGAAFGFLLPAYAGQLGQVFLYLGVAGLGLKLIFRFS